MKHRLYSDAHEIAPAPVQLLEVIAEPVPIEALRSSRSGCRHRRRDDVARQLHANAQFALIVSLMSFLFPLTLPFGLFLGWRVRTEAKRSMPQLVEWVSLPFYVASFGLWLGAVVALFGLSVVLLMCLR